MPNYLNPQEYHGAFVDSKINGKLTKKAIEMFGVHVDNVSSGVFNLKGTEKEDAKQTAYMDLISYWRNFKEFHSVRDAMCRNFVEGDKMEIAISNGMKVVVVMGKDVEVGDSLKTTLKALQDHLLTNKVTGVFYHKVRLSICFADHVNVLDHDAARKSYVIMTSALDEHYIKDVEPGSRVITRYMKPPGGAFAYFTTMIRNSILKHKRVQYPKGFNPSNVVSLSSINGGDGMFNL